MMTTNNEEKNYAPFWKKMMVAGAVVVTMTGLLVSQNLTQVSASKPSEYISVAEFSAGQTYATVLSTDGKAYSRGWNNFGQLGVQSGSKVNIADWTAINTPEKLTSVKASDHTVALGESGKLYTWGANDAGQVGNGNTSAVFTPTQITAVDRYAKVASGGSFSMALDSEGRLWTWGANNVGQLGNGTTTDSSNPQMVGGSNVFTDIYAAKETAYAIDGNGKLWAWGANKAGQIGDGTTNDRNKPAVVETGQTWSKISVSLASDTVLAIDRSGWLYSWGANANGLLGNGTDWRGLQNAENDRFKAMIDQISREDTQRRTDLVNKCIDDAYNPAHDAYNTQYAKLIKDKKDAEDKLKQDASQPTASPSPSPSVSASPSATATAVPTVSASPSPSPSISPIPDPSALKEPVRSDFADKCGSDVDKTFAKTDTSGMKPAVIKEPALKDANLKPAKVTSDYRVKDIAVGSENAYAVDVLNRLRSWGKDSHGQTGLGLEDDKSLTQVPVVAKEGVSAVGAGDKYGVAVATNGDLLLWGTNNAGVLMSKPSDEPKLLAPTVKGKGYTGVTAGLTTVYGFKNQTVSVWGNNSNGELGIGSTDGATYSPTELDRKIDSIAPSAKGVVALGTSNQLMYWGSNSSGQFGNSKTSSDVERKVSSNEISTFTAIAAGDKFTTAISSDGRMWGWGSNSKSLLDLGATKDLSNPAVVNTGFSKVTAIAAGKNVSAMTDGSSLSIWAGGVAHAFELANIAELAAGYDHVVARTKEGKVYVWSLNQNGLRAGSKPDTLTQVDDRTYSDIAAGGTISGATTDKGAAVIWGANTDSLRLADSEGSPVKNFEFTKLSIGDGYVLATDKNNVLWGWGENRYLVLGSQSVYKFPTVLTSKKTVNNAAKEGK